MALAKRINQSSALFAVVRTWSNGKVLAVEEQQR
jgi:hypothetical protein